MTKDNRKTLGVPHSYRIEAEEQKQIIVDYRNGMSAREVGRKYNRPHSSISRFLKKQNIIVKSSYIMSKKYTLNEHYFDEIDCHKKAYWVGWLTADGYVLPNMKETRLRLQKRDIDVVDRLRKDLGSNVPITVRVTKPTGLLKRCGTKKTYTSCGISISSDKIAKALSSYGVVPNKSRINKGPKNIPEEFIGSFILGHFEGDGCIALREGLGSATLSIWDNRSTCNFIKLAINKKLGRGVGIVEKRRKINVYTFRISKHRDIFDVYQWMYSGIDICLERKRQKFLIAFANTVKIKEKQMAKKTSPYRGVYFSRQAGKFVANFEYKCHKYHVGIFDLDIDAAKARDKDIKRRNLQNKVVLNFP